MGLRQRLPFAGSLLLLATASALAAPAVSTATDFGPIVDCPSSVTLQTLIGLRQRSPSAGRECYGSTELVFVAFRAAPEGLGGTTEFLVEPDWLDPDRAYGNGLMLTDEHDEYGYRSRWMDVRIPPDLQESFSALAGQWVEVAGHHDDPAAATCHVTEGDPDVIPPPAAVIESCRDGFVLTSIEPIDSPCPAASDWSAIVATPEHLRATCFDGDVLRFEARGGSVTTVFGIAGPIEGTWELYDAVADVAWQGPSLEAFAPPAAGLHLPPGVVAGDGVGGREVVWRITAHVDDSRASDCRPDGDGLIVDGVLLGWDPDEAVAFCRNHLFIDEATWIRPAVAVADPTSSNVAPPPAAAPPIAAPPTVPPTFAEPAPKADDAPGGTPGRAAPPSLPLVFGVLALLAGATTVLGERLRRA